jgi:hypothetical protein
MTNDNDRAARPRQLGQDRVSESLSKVSYRLMETDEDRDQVFRLRYRAYLREGAIGPNPSESFSDTFDDAPNAWNFGIYYEGTLASALRVSVSTPEHPQTPSIHVFEDLLEQHLREGKIIVDPTRFVADPDLPKRIAMLPYLAVRLGYMACDHFNADLGLATVRNEHVAFYKRTFMHEQVSEPREYLGLTKPLNLMVSDFQMVREQIEERYPIFQSTPSERAALYGAAPNMVMEVKGPISP